MQDIRENRLNRIADQLRLVVDVRRQAEPAPHDVPGPADDVLALLERGEITPDEAVERLGR